MSGSIAVNVLPPPIHFSNRIFVSATDVIEEVSSATVRTSSTGIWLTSRIDRTARRDWRFARAWLFDALKESGN